MGSLGALGSVAAMGEWSDEARGLMESAAVERYGTSSETPPEPQVRAHVTSWMGAP